MSHLKTIKGIVHPKMVQVVPNLHELVSSAWHKRRCVKECW